MARYSGNWRGISRMPSHVPPFERHFIRVGDQALKNVFIPETLRDHLETAGRGQVELHTGHIGVCRIVLSARFGSGTVRAGLRDLVWSTLFVPPVIFLGLFALTIWTLFAFGSGSNPQISQALMAAALLLPGLGLFQMLNNARRWLMWR